ncbi:MAG: hypothetical protein K0R47_3296 [Brevibacillus sp.]|nr:hypothetical protein [Brevibacillus sp.]
MKGRPSRVLCFCLTAAQEKGEKSEGIRDTAEAEWKKRNTLERPPLNSFVEAATLDAVPLLEWSRAGMTPEKVSLLTWSFFSFFRPTTTAINQALYLPAMFLTFKATKGIIAYNKVNYSEY